MRTYMLEEIPLPPGMRDATPTDVWRQSVASTRAAIINMPRILTIAALVLVVAAAAMIVPIAMIGFTLTRGLVVIASVISMAAILTVAVWFATLLSDLLPALRRSQRRIVDEHCAVTLIEQHRPGQTPAWKLGSHHAYPQRRGHGRRFRDELLQAALPVAYPRTGEPRAVIHLSVSEPKVLDLYRRSLAQHGFEVVVDKLRRRGGGRYTIRRIVE